MSLVLDPTLYFTHQNSEGLIEIVEIATGKIVGLQKSVMDLLSSKNVEFNIVKLKDGTQALMEKGLNVDLLDGRSSYAYSETLADIICQRIEGGELLKDFCGTRGIPPRTIINRWINQNPEFAKKIERALKHRASFLAEKAMDVVARADDGLSKDDVPSQRLAFDGYMELAKRDDPSKGEKGSGKVQINVMIDTGVHKEDWLREKQAMVIQGENNNENLASRQDPLKLGEKDQEDS
jgi:hypothetical protein